MNHRFVIWAIVAVLSLLTALADNGAAQSADQADKQEKKGDKVQSAPRKITTLLNMQVDMKEHQAEHSLKDVLIFLQDMLTAGGEEFPIIVDTDAFKEENPDAPDIYETRVRYAPVPRKITVAHALRLALSKVPTNNATFVIYGSHLEITTYERASVEQRLQQRVIANFDKRKLSDVLRELSEQTGTTIIVDKRAGDKEERIMSATFVNDVSLAGALRVLSEMAELKVVVLEGALYVTTPQHAETLRKEKVQMDEQLSPLWPILPPYRLRSRVAGIAGLGGLNPLLGLPLGGGLPGIGPNFRR